MMNLDVASFVFIVCFTYVSAQQAQTLPITTTPYGISLEFGANGSVACAFNTDVYTGNLTISSLRWFTPTGDAVPIFNVSSGDTKPTPRIYVRMDTAALVLSNASSIDRGNWICSDVLRELANVTTLVVVYEMPSYVKEGVIVLVVNACLLVIFLACSLYTWIRSRKTAKYESATLKVPQHDKLASDIDAEADGFYSS